MATQLADLYGFITSYYSLDEISTLCLELDIEADNLGGRTRNAKARELVLHMGREQRFDDLFAALQASRPNLFESAEFDTRPEALKATYAELEAFAQKTRPLSEVMLGRVGLEQRAGFVGTLLFVVLASALLYAGLREVGPDRMSGDFNLAVAPFSVVGEEADARAGVDVANSIYGRLTANVEALTAPIIHVWGPTEPRLSPIRSIEGDTPAEREAAAAALAEKIDADIVVYGVVTTTQQKWHVTPEFYISPKNFSDASEILGQHSLGEIFTVPGNDRRALRITSGEKLTPRAEIISQMAVALTYYSISNYKRALEYLQAIEQDEDIVLDDNGAEVVYLLMGNTLNKLAQQQGQFALDEDEADIALRKQYWQKYYVLLGEADQYYGRALEVDAEYSRALVGRGNIAYLRYILTKNIADFDNAIALCEQALHATNRLASYHIETKVHFCLGQSYGQRSRVETEAGNRERAINRERAMAELHAVVADYEANQDPRLREMAGEAHARLGSLYKDEAKYQQAIGAYQRAIELLEDRPERVMLYQKRLATVIAKRDEQQELLDQ